MTPDDDLRMTFLPQPPQAGMKIVPVKVETQNLSYMFNDNNGIVYPESIIYHDNLSIPVKVYLLYGIEYDYYLYMIINTILYHSVYHYQYGIIYEMTMIYSIIWMLYMITRP